VSVEFRHINLAYLEHVTEGDRVMQRDLLNLLVKELQADIPAMRAHLDGGRWQELVDVSHRLRSSLAFAGNERVTWVDAEIERLAGGGGEHARLPVLLGELEAALPNLILELQAAAAATA
jgi:HPt (histidine-containing phosphotransfer) domain-containing protein